MRCVSLLLAMMMFSVVSVYADSGTESELQTEPLMERFHDEVQKSHKLDGRRALYSAVAAEAAEEGKDIIEFVKEGVEGQGSKAERLMVERLFVEHRWKLLLREHQSGVPYVQLEQHVDFMISAPSDAVETLHGYDTFGDHEDKDYRIARIHEGFENRALYWYRRDPAAASLSKVRRYGRRVRELEERLRRYEEQSPDHSQLSMVEERLEEVRELFRRYSDEHTSGISWELKKEIDEIAPERTEGLEFDAEAAWLETLTEEEREHYRNRHSKEE